MTRFVFYFFLINSIFAQTFVVNERIGQFSKANAFTYNPAGFIYVSDSETNEITKLDTLGNIIKYIGGYGWDNDGFDEPTDIFANTLNVYVADKNNHRIQVFDKDLNFIFQVSGKYKSDITNQNRMEENVFGFPLSCVVSNLGDLFVLDSENKKIIKFNSQGNFILDFGGFNYGEFALSNPRVIDISSNNIIFVLDNEQLIIFDEYGNGLRVTKLPPQIRNISITDNLLLMISNDTIFYSDLNESSNLKELEIEIQSDIKIIDAMLIKDELYILTEKQVEVLKKEKAD